MHKHDTFVITNNSLTASITNLFHIISVKVITGLAAINASTLGVNTVLAEPEPARGFGAVGGANSGGEAEPPNTFLCAQKP